MSCLCVLFVLFMNAFCRSPEFAYSTLRTRVQHASKLSSGNLFFVLAADVGHSGTVAQAARCVTAQWNSGSGGYMRDWDRVLGTRESYGGREKTEMVLRAPVGRHEPGTACLPRRS